MKPKFTLIATAAVLGCLILTLNVQLSTAFAQGSAFTYQGRLNAGSDLANGSYDFTFQLFDAPTGGAGQGGPIITNGITLTDGLFTVTLDFGAGPFTNGAPRWLEIGVRPSGGGSFGTLNPRQALTATPYAITAANFTGTLPVAQLSGTIPSSQLAGTYSGAVSFNNASNQFNGVFAGNGGGLSNVSAVTLGGLPSSGFWQVAGNILTPGQFLGSTNFQPLEFRVNNLPALQLVPTTNTANFIGGDSNNFVAPGVYGATIGGGGTLAYPGGTGLTNKVLAHFATISGGVGNTAGGNANVPNGDSATVGGGWQNSSLGNNATVAGGVQNTALGDNSTVGGGALHMSSGQNSTVAGGIGNTNSGYTSTTGGGYYNTNSGYIATIAGGGNNLSSGTQSTVGGGALNTSSGFDSTVAGGSENIASGQGSTVAGGLQNVSSNFNATVPGGRGNIAGGVGSFAAGSLARALHDGAFVWADVTGVPFTSTTNNQFLIRAAGGVGINTSNPVSDLHVNGTVVIQGGISPVSTSSSNLLNLMVGGGSLPAATNGSLNGISFYEGAAAKAMSLGYDGSGAFSANALRIYGANDTPLFSFLNGGSMGVGTSTPASALHVKAPSDTEISVESSDAGAHRWTLQSSRVTGSAATDASFQIIDRTLNRSRLLIDTNGNVGIGKTTPSTTLDVNGIVTASGFQGSGAGLSNVNAGTLAGLGASNLWTTAGNAGTTPVLNFLGTTDNQPLELRVGGVRALRLEPTVNDANHLNIINVIAGSRGNFVSNGVYGATIAGGGAENYLGFAFTNSVSANFGTVGGGFQNLANGVAATVGGGAQNTADFSLSTVGGGEGNVASGTFGGAATVGGGSDNKAIGDFSTVGGGQDNTATAYSSAIGGGFLNTASNLEATVAGGFNNIAAGAQSTVAGGDFNTATGNRGTVGGGERNVASGESSTVSGGDQNTAGGDLIAGYATVPGGRNNLANGNYSFAAGYQAQALHDGAFVWADAIGAPFTSTGSNQFLIRASGGVGIGTTTPEAPLHVAESSAGTVTANANSIAVLERGGNGYLSVLGPVANEVGILFGNPNASTDGGIVFNNSLAPSGLEFRTGTNVNRMTILASGNVGIGTTSPSRELEVQSPSDTEIGLKSTDAGGHLWTIQSSSVTGSSRDASFQIIDRTANSSRLLVDTNGLVGIGTASPTNRLHVNGGITCTALVQTSDRNAKENFVPVSPSEVLSKVAALPITTWNFKALHDGRHMGPMAQDFYAAFGLGGSETTITAVDPDGVALAAIQGLNQKLEGELRSKDAELAELKARLERIEQILSRHEKNEE